MGDMITQPPFLDGATGRSISVMLEAAGHHAGCRSVSGPHLRLTGIGKPAHGCHSLPVMKSWDYLLDAAEADRMQAGRSRVQR